MSNYKIFCDESNHLENDSSNLMILGAIQCPEEEVIRANKTIKYLRHKHDYVKEIKWTKVSENQKSFYDELLEYFFSSVHLRFKGTVVINKSYLEHELFSSTHDEFYYKMYYYTLRDFLNTGNRYKIYLDYKDSQGGKRLSKLKEVFVNKSHGNTDPEFTIIHSHESQLLQVCDLLIGALGYKNRNDIEHSSSIKNHIVQTIEQHIGHDLALGTPQWESKFNIFRFSPRRFNV